MNRIRVYGLTCVLMLVAGLASATTIVMPADEQLIAKAPVIVDGTVVSSGVVERDGRIWTETVVSVARTLKGTAEETIVVREIGGELDGRVTRIFGTPEFAAGEHVLLFLEKAPQGGYRTMDLFVGKFSGASMMDGRRLWLRNDQAEHVTLLDADLRPLPPQNVQREATKFEQYVKERVAGRPGLANYGVVNPVLARGDESGGRKVEANFTLISEPTVYRWFAFDSNQTANWYSGGTQTGYTGGGVTELQTAMGVWTNYSQANINYAYAGTRAGPWGGLTTRNNVNEVLFDDPNNEIAGTFNRTTGGVVGTGGFNGVTNGGNWTAPFTADAAHPAGVVRAFNIVEGNLTIQDGVTPTAGISGTRLAEIVAHEFGHTLGFGHSPDATALMYASVTGLGPSLRDDDKTAARWLYPSGGTVEPPPPIQAPAAPSGLIAVPLTSTIELRWNDNSSNEAGFSVYVASGTDAFQRIGDVGVNVEEATLSGVTAGSYRIYVVAFNGGGKSAQSNTVNVTVGASLTAAFSFSPQTGTAGATTFTFYDESRGTVSQRSWDFGDGTTSTAAVVNKIYARSGRYTVTLTVTGGGQTASTSQTLNVSGPLAAAFHFEPANPTTNDTINFVDDSTGGVTSWRWVFGDGQNSTVQNPNKRYSTAQSYTVTLTVFRNSESASLSKTVTVAEPAPVTPAITAAFDFSPAAPQPGENITFTDRSTGSPSSWSWIFGDGRASSARNPVISYPVPGTYTVTLIASKGGSSAHVMRQIVVAAPAAQRSLISVTTQTNGIGGSAWRTELTLFNAGTQGASVNLLFLPGAGGSVISRSLFLSPRQSRTYANTLLDLFGVPNGAGALAIEASSAGASAQLRVSSRTYTEGPNGTYGQAVPDVAALDKDLYITGMQSNESYRTNIGLVNRGDREMAVGLILYDASGDVVDTASVTIPANNFQQSSLGSLFELSESYDVLSMQVIAPAADAVSAYASVIDNLTQDPVYIQAVPAAKGGSLTIPTIGRAPGANGTFWRSDVSFYNPGAQTLNLVLHYNGDSTALNLPPRDTVVLADILDGYGVESGSGAMRVTWINTTGPVVTSRTYTSTERGGTYGQSIDPVDAFSNQVYVPGLRNDGSYRSNAGFVNGGENTESFFVTLLSSAGTEIGSTTMTLGPGGQTQASISALFPNLSQTGSFTLSVRGDGDAKLFAYGSMVDNRSGDPVFFAGR